MNRPCFLDGGKKSLKKSLNYITRTLFPAANSRPNEVRKKERKNK